MPKTATKKVQPPLLSTSDNFPTQASSPEAKGCRGGLKIRTRRPLPELPPDLAEHRCLDKLDLAALLHVSPKKIDRFVYGDVKRNIAPGGGPPSILIGRRRVWRLRDVLRWLSRQPKG